MITRSWNPFSKIVFLLLVCALGKTSAGQTGTTPPNPLTLEDAITYGLQNYPQVRAAMEQVVATQSAVTLSKTAYLPRADMLWQTNRATRNNIFGLLFPQSVISQISGPVLATTSMDSVWGNAAGLLVSWQPFDFGRRGATVNAARAGQQVARSQLSVTRLDVAVAIANAYFIVAAAQQRVVAGKADVDRRAALANVIHVLVKNDLRPGADASRADAELARAEVSLIQAEQAEKVSREILAQLLGIAGADVQIQAGSLLSIPPQMNEATSPVSMHPVAVAEEARVEQLTAQKKVLDRSYFPRFDVQSTIFGRGSGANADGSLQIGTGGLGFDRANWAVGLTMTFPAFDIFSIRAQKQIVIADESAERARYRLVTNDLTSQLRQAQTILDSARQVAEKTPIELQAARDAETRARARYEAGLATIVEVADTQSLLVQAQIDDALARLAIWNDLGTVAAAHGDLQPFLEMVRKSTSGGH